MNIGGFLLTNLCNGLMAVVLLVIGYKVFDLMTPGWDFKNVFTKSTLTNGGLVIAAFLIGLAVVIARSVG